jgi:bifunctional UDP-N-acetylglucosamine pyrophosphorylase/glucosamine-1-phosphate N-acetyltransferase
VVGDDCVIGPNSRLENARVGNGCTVDETIIVDSQIDDDVCCGPRAYLRGNTHFLKGSKAGTHVELKNSTVGEGSKVPHLSYIGDTTMGAHVNIGGGSITCNYDGVNKNKTTIGDGAFIGSDTMMVAPVNIGADALTGASSCITQDVPAGALAVERADVRIVEGYVAKRRERLEKGNR